MQQESANPCYFTIFITKKNCICFFGTKCAETTIEYLTRYGCYGQTELFESMERGMRAKMEIIRQYPDMATFTIKAFYEKDPEICAAIQESYHKYFNLKADKTRLNLDPAQFIPGLDVAIVCALQHMPELLILDEPTGGLDPLMQKEFFDILQERNKEGTTIFLSSHVLSEIQRNCTRAAIIRDGRIIACDSVEALAKTNASVFLSTAV